MGGVKTTKKWPFSLPGKKKTKKTKSTAALTPGHRRRRKRKEKEPEPWSQWPRGLSPRRRRAYRFVWSKRLKMKKWKESRRYEEEREREKMGCFFSFFFLEEAPRESSFFFPLLPHPLSPCPRNSIEE